jgi:hypothetical protein
VISRYYVTFGLALSVLGCSSREVPSTFPKGSPASHSATEAPRADVARSLREDPPLPGARTEGWAGLAPEEDTAPSAHEHTAVYTCPMHPEVTSNEPGICPKCGMKLEVRK